MVSGYNGETVRVWVGSCGFKNNDKIWLDVIVSDYIEGVHGLCNTARSSSIRINKTNTNIYEGQ